LFETVSCSNNLKIMRLYLLIFFCCLIAHTLLAQDPWPKGKGKGYAQLAFNNIPTYSSVFDGANTRITERELSERILTAYAEIGITNRLSLGTNIPLSFLSSGASSDTIIVPTFPEGNLSSLGNISLFGKYTVLDSKLKIAIISQVDLPTSTQDDLTGLATGVNATSIQPKLSFGGSKNNFFAYGYFGYGFRNNNYHDFLNFGIEGGLKVGDNVSVILNIFRLHNLNNGDSAVDSPASIETGFYTSFQEYNAFLFKIFAENLAGGLGGFVSLGGGSGTSVAASPALTIGGFYKW